MRIRRSASRLLGSSSYCAAPGPEALGPGAAAAAPLDLRLPPPPPCPAPPESHGGAGPATASGEPCELSRSPWDLIAELSLPDPQEEDDLVDRYFVHVTTRASWLFSPSIPAASAKKKARLAAADGAKRPESKKKKKAKVKKEAGAVVRVWRCKKHDGKRWHCHRLVNRPDTLCDYHFVQKRSYMNPDFDVETARESVDVVAPPPPPPVPVPVPAAPRPASKHSSGSSKSRKKKPASDFIATEGFYYYAGFGLRSKRQCRSTGGGTNEPDVPAKQEEEEAAELPQDASPPADQAKARDASPPADQAKARDASPPADQAQARADDDDDDGASHRAAADRGAASSVEDDDDIAGIAGVDEDSSDEDDDFDGVGTSGRHGTNGNGGDGKRKAPWKRWRKPVKARSLKSLM